MFLIYKIIHMDIDQTLVFGVHLFFVMVMFSGVFYFWGSFISLLSVLLVYFIITLLYFAGGDIVDGIRSAWNLCGNQMGAFFCLLWTALLVFIIELAIYFATNFIVPHK